MSNEPLPFLAAERGAPRPSADAILFGLATDGGVSFRGGAAEGPGGIRRFSESIESYSPGTGCDLADIDLVDAGDHTGAREDVGRVVGELVASAWSGESRPLLGFLGGDHSVTPPTVSAVAERTDRLALVGFDAHLDLREGPQTRGSARLRTGVLPPWTPGDHACTYRRISEGGVDCYVFGSRSGAREEWADAPGVLAHLSGDVEVGADVLEALAGRPVYVTIDIDVLDPSVAPGTGNPEPGGPGFDRLLAALGSLAALDVVAFDVVEVSPPLDPSGITQAAAAVLVRESVLRYA